MKISVTQASNRFSQLE